MIHLFFECHSSCSSLGQCCLSFSPFSCFGPFPQAGFSGLWQASDVLCTRGKPSALVPGAPGLQSSLQCFWKTFKMKVLVYPRCFNLKKNRFWRKSPQTILMLPPVKKVHPLLYCIKIHPHVCLELFWTVFTCKWCLICAYLSPDLDEMTFTLNIVNWELLSWNQRFEVKNVLMMDLFTNMQRFASLNDLHWSGVDCLWIIVMFLTAAWTLILMAPIHCRGSVG